MTHCTFISYLWVIHKCLCNLFRFRMTSDMPQKEQKRGVGGSYLKWCPLLPSLSQQQSWSRAGRTVRECRHAYAADKEIVVTAGEAAGGWWLLDDWCKSGVFVCVCWKLPVQRPWAADQRKFSCFWITIPVIKQSAFLKRFKTHSLLLRRCRSTLSADLSVFKEPFSHRAGVWDNRRGKLD